MAIAIPSVIQILIEDLPAFYLNLALTLFKTGTAVAPDATQGENIEFRCESCDIPVTCRELEKVALAKDSLELPEPKLKRVKVGCCAREGCNASAYQLRLLSPSNFDWERIIAEAFKLTQQQKANAATQRQQQSNLQRRRRFLSNLKALVILVVLLVGAFWWRFGRLPFAKKTPKYRVDPASLGPDLRPQK